MSPDTLTPNGHGHHSCQGLWDKPLHSCGTGGLEGPLAHKSISLCSPGALPPGPPFTPRLRLGAAVGERGATFSYFSSYSNPLEGAWGCFWRSFCKKRSYMNLNITSLTHSTRTTQLNLILKDRMISKIFEYRPIK